MVARSRRLVARRKVPVLRVRGLIRTSRGASAASFNHEAVRDHQLWRRSGRGTATPPDVRSRSRAAACELVARGDVELGEHLAQVVGDGVLADEQPRADVSVGEAVAGEPRDLSFLGGELVRVSTLRLRTRSPVASSSRSARPANASVPMLVNISSAVRSCSRASSRRRSRRSHSPYRRWARARSSAKARAGEPFDRLAIEALGGVAVAEQRARAGLDTQPQSVPLARAVAASHSRASSARCSLAGAAGSLDQLDRSPRRIPQLMRIVRSACSAAARAAS